MTNRDDAVVDDFGDEWARFDQSALSQEEWERIAASYFAALPWDVVPPDALAVDVGCGSGRWAQWMAPRVGRLVCVDASRQAVQVARRALRGHANTVVVQASVDAVPVAPGTADIVYSLGVLHHVPDTAAAIADCAALLKPGGVLHLYLYYSFENRPAWFRALWKASDAGRTLVSRAPRPVKNGVCEVIAVTVYWPLARLALLLERIGIDPTGLPLAPYRHLSLYSMRTDARDRFGTRLERRFSRAEITDLLTAAGLVDIRIPDAFPYWIAVARRPSTAPGKARAAVTT
jgi:SAM-dependent methyltransferase